jgi:hypothetical protein
MKTMFNTTTDFCDGILTILESLPYYCNIMIMTTITVLAITITIITVLTGLE